MAGKPELEQLRIRVNCDSTEDGAPALVSASLDAEIAARFGARNEQALSICAYDGAEAVIGGLNGVMHWGWFYIRQLWVAEPHRGRDVGRSLLAQAEAAALDRKCVGLYLDTFDPVMEKFYERFGFVRSGQIENFPPGHARIFLCKKLPPA